VDNLTLEVDFSGITEGASLSYLTSGLHQAVIAEYNFYQDDNVLYVYMDTEGVRHRSSFRLNYDGGKKALLRFLISSGIKSDKLENKKVKTPFHKTVGRSVYFNYTAPTMGDDGKPVEGSWAKYEWHSQSRWEAINNMMNSSTDEPVEPKVSNGGGSPVTPTKESEDDFDFLLNDSP
jgi:hypothetical protein